MSADPLRPLLRPVALAVAMAVTGLAATGRTAIAQTGVVTGRVTAGGSSIPIVSARVTVVGTALVAVTTPDGRYALRNVPAGPHDVRVLRVGFAEQKRAVTVASGGTVSADFSLQQVAVQLQEIVSTATGPQRRVELGNAVSNVDVAARAAQSPATDIASLLNNQAPGVQVQPPNTTGAGARIRIRGVNSLTLANDPIYFIDGVRMTSSNGSQSGNIFTGGAIQSRAQDINPDDIESMEVVKGPSAATLYGTDAANGVILITTKRGRAGETNYTVFGEAGAIKDNNTYPTAYTLFGHAPAGTTASCATTALTQVSSGRCIADSLSKFNLFTDPNTTPLTTGGRRHGGLQIRGGSNAVRFFASGGYEDETGVLGIPNFDMRRLDTLGFKVRPEWQTPNELKRGSFRTNLDATLSSQLEAHFSGEFISLQSRLPQSDNNSLGLLSNAFGGPGYATGRTSTLGFDLHGYRQSTPAESFQDVATQYINRFLGSTSLSYTPKSWLLAHADIGLDNAARTDHQYCARGNCADVGTTRLGFVQEDRASLNTATVNATVSANLPLRSGLTSRTTVGTQYTLQSLDRNGAGASNLAAGGSTLNAGATQVTDAANSMSKTLGLFVEEQVGVRDRLFLTAGVRTDQNSAFGTNFQRVVYPKGSVSYVISDEPFFPKPRFLDQLRLRAAYGASGVQPGPLDALNYYNPTTVNVANSDQPAILYFSLGNTQLRPERATEFEGGFDTRFFGSRATLEVTYYSKRTKDALVGAIVPPSLGTGATSQRSNLGSTKNAGLEVGVTGQVVTSPAFGWNIGLNGSTNANKLLTLGKDAQGNPLPAQIGATTRNQPGYPLFGYWERPIKGYNDKNGDGVLTVDEVQVGDTAVFQGYSFPRYALALTNGFDLFHSQIHVNTLFDYKGGNKLLNGTERIRCQSRNNCYGAYDRTAPLAEQARAVAVRENVYHTQAGYMEDDSFIRFRELSVGYTLPRSVLSHSRVAKSATLTFAARNLHVWTKYSGLDPESNADAGSTATTPSDFQTLPPPSYFIFRLNLGF